MDYKFLNKVVDQIVSETRIDYDMEEIQFPFPSSLFSFRSILPSLLLFLFFRHLSILFPNHCRDIYGLNDDEIEYVWKEYREIVKDKINSNGL
jgi:hypothetical protein